MHRTDNKKNLSWSDPTAIARLVASLQQDHVSIVSTDTILGFLASLSKKSFEQLNDLKGGRQQKPYVILIGSCAKLDVFVDVQALDAGLKNVLQHCWPGPITFVFKARSGLAEHLVSPDGTIALRSPKHAGLLSALTHFDGLFSTSANKSGESVPVAADQLNPDLVKRIALVVVDQETDGARDHERPSTIIDVSQIGRAKVIRQGAYPIDALLRLGLQID